MTEPDAEISVGDGITHGISLAAACKVWLRISLLSFGGPAGQIAMMHRTLVEEQRWISDIAYGSVSKKVETATTSPIESRERTALRSVASRSPAFDARLDPSAIAASATCYACAAAEKLMAGVRVAMGSSSKSGARFPGRTVFQQFADQRRVHGMARALGHHAALQAAPGQCQVADQVEHLVPHKLVSITQGTVEHGAAADDDRARLAGAADQAHVAQHRLVFAKAEGARRCDQVGVSACLQIAKETRRTDGAGKSMR